MSGSSRTSDGCFGVLIDLHALDDPRPGATTGPSWCWERQLWFCFEVRVAAWGLAWQSSHRVSVVVDPASERAQVVAVSPWPAGGQSPEPPAVPLRGLVAVAGMGSGLAWVSDYELQRLAGVAAQAAARAGRQLMRALVQTLRPVYQAEARRLAAYFARRRAEAVLAAVGGVREMERASALAAVGADGGSRDGARRLARRAAARWDEALETVRAVEAERVRALAELRARARPCATLVPSGLAIGWQRRVQRDREGADAAGRPA